jgi:hypothetical protein
MEHHPDGKAKPMTSEAREIVGNPICPKCLTAHPAVWDCTMIPLLPPNSKDKAMTDEYEAFAQRAKYYPGSVKEIAQRLRDFVEAKLAEVRAVDAGMIDEMHTTIAEQAAELAKLRAKIAVQEIELHGVPAQGNPISIFDLGGSNAK